MLFRSMVAVSGENIKTGNSYTITAGSESITIQGGESSNLNTSGMGGHGGRRQ